MGWVHVDDVAGHEPIEADRGRWVLYSFHYGHRERRRIKSWSNSLYYVVYRCGEHWERFELYDAAPTLPAQLQFVEEPE
jgi:hypothetical protein